MRKRLLLIALVGMAAATATFALANARAGSGPIAYASGHQQISSSPGVYAQTTSEYAGSWSWTQDSAAWDYYWYVFHNDGTLAGSGHKQNGGGDSWSGAPNIYYFKEYNNEPLGSGRVNILGVDYCC
jgi:hypothetical protein